MHEILHTLVGIAAVVPRSLVLTFREGPRVHCGESKIVPGQDFALFDWFPMAIGVMESAADGAHYAAARKIEQYLWREIGRSIPIPYDDACGLVTQIASENAEAAAKEST